MFTQYAPITAISHANFHQFRQCGCNYFLVHYNDITCKPPLLARSSIQSLKFFFYQILPLIHSTPIKHLVWILTAKRHTLSPELSEASYTMITPPHSPSNTSIISILHNFHLCLTLFLLSVIFQNLSKRTTKAFVMFSWGLYNASKPTGITNTKTPLRNDKKCYKSKTVFILICHLMYHISISSHLCKTTFQLPVPDHAYSSLFRINRN